MIRFTDPLGNDLWLSPPFDAVCEALKETTQSYPNHNTKIFIPDRVDPFFVQQTVEEVIMKYKNAGFADSLYYGVDG